MDRRDFILKSTLLTGGAFIASTVLSASIMYKPSPLVVPSIHKFSHRLPASSVAFRETAGYIEDDPKPDYTWASDQAYEDFLDMKFGIRLHWGLYSILQLANESWPYLTMSLAQRQTYQELYKSWYPSDFNADEWMDFFADSGAKMFAFTTKHHDGFSMFDTKTRVKKRANWLAPGGPVIEDCDEAYSIMETPFKRDVVKELCDAARKKRIKIDLYFSHPDWNDADFRPYNFHPLQVPDGPKLAVRGKDNHPELKDPKTKFGSSGLVMVANPTKEEVDRMMARHRAQLAELITNYGDIDMIDLDMFLGPEVWPALRKTMYYLRKLRPNVMYRARGIGNYGDYYTPEGFVPGNKENTDTPWFVIYPLGNTFSFDPHPENYKGTKWIIKNLIDSVAKGGNFMAAIGPDGTGKFHPKAIEQLKETGKWLKINGKGIYATRAREADLWKEGEQIRFTRSKDNKTIYAFSNEWPNGNLVLSTVKPRRGSKIYLLGSNKTVRWNYGKQKGLVIETPVELKSTLPDVAHFAYGFVISVV